MRTASRGIIVITMLVLTVAVSTPAQAANEPTLKDLAKRGVAGKLTQADRDYLSANLDVAALVPDATLTETGEMPLTAAELEQVGALATTCAGTNRYQIVKSWPLQSTLFEYHTYMYWCWDSAGVYVRDHYPYISNAQTVVVNKGITVNKLRSFGAFSKEANHQNHVQLCALKVGCYSNIYPTNWVLVKNATGSTFRWDN